MNFEQVIDEFLCSGSNRKYSQERIAYWFSCLPTVDERILFLKDEYNKGGKGFEFDGTKYAAFFDEDGYTVAVGNTVNCNATVKLSWAEVEQHIHAKLSEGKYCDQSVIDRARDIVLKETASMICNLKQAVIREVWDQTMGKEWFSGQWAEIEQNLKTLMENDIEAVLERLHNLCSAYKEDNQIMRYRYSYTPQTMYDTVKKLKYPSKEWGTVTGAATDRKVFITRDEIDTFLKKEKSSRDNRLNTYSFFTLNSKRSERAEFLKSSHNSYEGGSPAWYLTDSSSYEYNGKGLKLCRNGYSVKLSWTELVDHIDRLISNKAYLSQGDYERMETYEREEMGKIIGRFYYCLPKECQRPWSASEANKYSYYGTCEYMKNLAALIDTTDKLEAVFAGMNNAFSQIERAFPRYEYLQECLDKILRYCEGSIMFPRDVVVNKSKEISKVYTPFPEMIGKRDEGEQYSLFDYFGVIAGD